MARVHPEVLSRRETEVLAAIERRLTNSEIAAELFVSVRTVESHVAALRRKISVASRGALIEYAQAQRRLQVPARHDSFVGRSAEIVLLSEALDNSNWVTVCGPPGVGKSRLVAEFAASSERIPIIADVGANGVDPLSEVARALGVLVGDRPSTEASCAVALAAHHHLLVLDNCDRGAGSVADLVMELLNGAPGTHVLTTCRSPVNGKGERIVSVGPLRCESNDEQPADAVQLFLDRADLSLASLSGDERKQIEGICVRLDGLALAIELAAGLSRHFPVAELASHLQQNLGLLDTAQAHNGAGSLGTAIGSSVDLLDDSAGLLLRHLGALPGPFTVDLVAEVADTGSTSDLLRLLDGSLVAATATETSPRTFRLLGPIREFVLARTSNHTINHVRSAHAQWALERAEELAGRVRTDGHQALSAEAKAHAPDTAAALTWVTTNNPAKAPALAASLAVMAEQVGPDLASLNAIAEAVQVPAVIDAATATELALVGSALSYGHVELMSSVAKSALSLAGNRQDQLAAHRLAGWTELRLANPEAALEHLVKAQELAVILEDTWQQGSILQAKALALSDGSLGRSEEAMAAFYDAMQAFAKAGDAMHVNNCRYMMAATAVELAMNGLEVADWIEQCETYARQSSNDQELGHALLIKAQINGVANRQVELDHALQLFNIVGDLRCISRCYLLLAQDQEGDRRIPLLETALEVASRAGDQSRQADAVKRLIEVHWDLGHEHRAATYFGALRSIVGQTPAEALCPEAMLGRRDLDAAVLEGAAAFHKP